MSVGLGIQAYGVLLQDPHGVIHALHETCSVELSRVLEDAGVDSRLMIPMGPCCQPDAICELASCGRALKEKVEA